jgi:hypothetical protein
MPPSSTSSMAFRKRASCTNDTGIGVGAYIFPPGSVTLYHHDEGARFVVH